MTITKVLREAERKFPSQLLGFILAIILALFWAYDKLLVDKHPQLYIDVQTSTSVLDIKEDLPKLDILFDGIDIRQQNLSLRIISVKVINDSSIDILKGQYDPEDPLGLQVSSGKIIKADLADTSNEYLRKTLTIRLDQENVLYLKDVILDAHQYFSVKLLILHPIDSAPSIKPVGHIAGVKMIKVRETYKEQGVASMWTRAFAGSWSVQGFRLFGYFFLSFGLLILIAAILSPINNLLNKQTRKENVGKFKRSTTLSLDDKDEFIFARYVETGFHELMIIRRIIQDEKTLARYYARAEETRGSSELYYFSKVASRAKVVSLEFSVLGLIDDLTKSGLIKNEGGIPSVDTHMKDVLIQFLAYLKGHRLVDKKDLDDEHFIITQKTSP